MVEATGAPDSIEARASHGGAVLVVRQLLGIGLSIVSVVAITRLLGPRPYGLFAIANGIAIYLGDVSRLGLDVYLIRYPGPLDERRVRVTQTLYTIIGIVVAVGFVATGPAVARWYGEPQLLGLFSAYAVIVPLLLYVAIPTAVLDRELNFKRVAAIELAGQVTNVAVALPLIWMYRSPWGLFAGIFSQALVVFCATWRSAGLRMGWHWDRDEAMRQVRYGSGYAASIWIWQARTLVNPLVVGTMLGSETVAYVAMAVRLATTLSFATSAVWRVYMSLLARLAHDRERMKAALEKGMVWQVTLVSVVFIAFSAISNEVIGAVMGERWVPVLRVFPFIAVATIVNSGFSLYSSALYVIEAWKPIAVFHMIHVLVLAIAAALLVASIRNIQAYGWAELLACGTYYSIRQTMWRYLFPVRERHLYAAIGFAVFLIATLNAIATSPVAFRLALGLSGAGALLWALPREPRDPLLKNSVKEFLRLSGFRPVAKRDTRRAQSSVAKPPVERLRSIENRGSE